MQATKKQWDYSPLLTIIIMIPMVSLYSFSLDLYIPLLPKVQQDLNTSKIMLQYGNSIFMLVCGIGQLFFGPLSDRFGRKPILLYSILFYISGAFLCIYSDTVGPFIISRILQAIGSCGAYLCCFATIRDIYHNPNKSGAMFSYLNIANSISAICAPTIGSFINNYYSWHAVFVVLLIDAICMLIYCKILFKETAPNIGIRGNGFIKNYIDIFKHINYQVYTLPAAIGIGSFFSFYCISPYLYQQILHVSQLHYSLLYGSCGLTFFIGSYICGVIIEKFGINTGMWSGLIVHLTGAIIILASYYYFKTTVLLPTHIGAILVILGSSFMIGAGIGGTMAPFKKIAGAAFAMISAYKFIFAKLMGDFVMSNYNDTPVSLAEVLIVLNIIAVLITFLFRGRIKHYKKEVEITSTKSIINTST